MKLIQLKQRVFKSQFPAGDYISCVKFQTCNKLQDRVAYTKSYKI